MTTGVWYAKCEKRNDTRTPGERHILNIQFERIDLSNPLEVGHVICMDEEIFPEDSLDDPDYWKIPALHAYWIIADKRFVGMVAVELDRAPGDRFSDDTIEDSGTIYIISIGVREAWRGGGIGNTAKKWTYTEAPFVKGMKRIVTTVRVGNAESFALNEAHEFEAVRAIPDFYPDGEDAQLFVRSIRA